MSRGPLSPLSNYLRDKKREQKRAMVQPVPHDESALQVSWLAVPTFTEGESTDPGDALGQLRPADAIRNQEQKKKLTPAPPADKIPFPGTGVELVRHIITEHLAEIDKAKRMGKPKRRIADTTLIKREVPRYCHEDGTPFDTDNVRRAWLQSLKRTRDGSY
jgi:hypothetical protein